MALDIAGPYRYPSPDQAWLDQLREEILEPALPIIEGMVHGSVVAPGTGLA